MLTRYGFTTVVDTASLLENTVEIRRRIEKGEVAGPRILTAGLALYPPNGIPFYVREAVPTDVLPLLRQPVTGAQAADTVRSNLNHGADIIGQFKGIAVILAFKVGMGKRLEHDGPQTRG